MSVWSLGRYLARHRARYAAGVVLLLATNACALLIPWVTKDVVDALGGTGRSGSVRGHGGDRHPPRRRACAGPGPRPHRVASRPARGGQQVETEIRADLFDAFLRLEPGFYQSRRTGDLMSRATNDLQSVSMLVGFGLLSLVNTAIVYAGTLVVMLRMDAWLTLAALAPYPLLVAVARRYNTRAHAEAVAVQEQLAHLATKVQENLSGMAVVRAYTLEPRENEEFGRLNQEHLARVLRQTRTHGVFSPLLAIMTGIGALGVLWVGGRAVLEGRLSLGVLVAFSGYVAYPRLAHDGARLGPGDHPPGAGRIRPGDRDPPHAPGDRRWARGDAARGPPAWRDRDPWTDVSLRAGPAGRAARPESPDRGGRLRRDRGPDRLGQEHARRAPAPGSGIRPPARSSSTGGTSTRSCSGTFGPRSASCRRRRSCSPERSART